ncbi:hypothetical protein AGLY_015186 [Aphis glycines]|uniref:THAP-type domain-containing protein n=1 Tax=Aphis glycines TaxID=307491 RepID=A0A6G0T290_APHGL|nr:hypothetical protein AGLY_015186 [Aphis glycines]
MKKFSILHDNKSLLNRKIKAKKKTLSSSQLTNKIWRYICYKQFTYWINSWNSIGKGNRIVIPSCVVNKIRQKYPEQDGCYVGYKSCTLGKMVLCSVFGCNSNNDKKRATCSQSGYIHFYSFPKRNKSPLRFKQWFNDFIPGSGSRICSKHFQEKDFTSESSKLQKQLLPNEKIRLYLNSDSIPTIYKVDDLRPKTPRNIRISRKRNEEDIISKQNSTNTSCDLGNECYTFYKPTNDISFEIENQEEEYEEEEEIYECKQTQQKPSSNIEDNSCFFVFWDCLLPLFNRCRQCNSTVVSVQHYIQGALQSVITICDRNHKLIWRSQNKSNKRPLGNILIGSALTLSGILYTQMCYTGPIICNIWENQKKSTIDSIKNSENDIWLVGDGQYDSSGFCAKYCIYSVMDLRSGKIVDFKLVQKGMVKGDLERKGCELLLDDLTKNQHFNIKLFLTDRHKGIRFYIRTQHPEIQHEFDVWHLSKSLMKKMKTLEKKHEDAYLWKSSINNHLWWASQNCKGDGQLLVEKFTSLLHHIKNEHEWEENGVSKTCDHDPLTDEEINKKLWLKSDNESYYALKKIITAKDFIKDLPHAKHFVHTGRLESYHNVRLKYMPKRIHLKYRSMYIRSIMAILDHNYNTNKQVVGDKMVYSKPLGKYTIKNVYERTDNDWRKRIMEKVLDLAKKKTNEYNIITIPEETEIPKSIAPIPKPNIEEIRSKRYSRFTI